MVKRISQTYLLSAAIVPLLLVFPALHFQPIVAYSIIFIITSLLFIPLCQFILKYNISPKYVFVFLVVGIALRLTLIFIHPIGSDDYYRYLWDGKVMANGINPYRYAPADSALSSFHSQVFPSKINHADMKTIYPPLAEMLFYASYKFGGESFIGLKSILLVFDLMTIWGIYLIIKKLGASGKNILIYALCPLPLYQFFIDGHMDGFGIPFLVFGILFYLKDKKLLSYFLIGLSICIKPMGLVLLPILFFLEKEWLGRIKIVLIPALVCMLLYLPFIFSGSPFQALVTFTENWTFNGIAFDFLNLFFNDNQRARALCAILFVIFYLPIVLSRKDILTKIYLSVFVLLIFSPVVHPWYLSWLAFLLPIRPRWSGIVFVSLISLTSFTLITYQLTGIWKEYVWVLLLEYLPVLVLFVYELVVSSRFEFQQ